MTLLDKIQTDIVTAMKAKEQMKLDTLRSIKTALDRYRVDQQKPVDEKVEQSILKTLSKQRVEAADAFRKGGREESATKEEAELKIIEGYMAQEATIEEIDAAVEAAFQDTEGSKRQMGVIMKIIPAYLAGKRVDGKVLSAKVKAKLNG
jgi:uncharacterized protein